MKKQISVLLLCFALIFSMTACGGNGGSQTGTDTEKQNLQAEQQEPEETSAFTEHLSLYRVKGSDYVSGPIGDDWMTFATCEYEGIYIDESQAGSYREMAGALKKLCSGFKDEALDVMDEYAEEAREMLEENEDIDFYQPSFFNTHLFVTRSDNNLLSFVEETTSYRGGAHPDTYYRGYNFNPETGEELEFTDIVNDEEAFEELVIEKLLEKYPETFSEYDESSMEELLEDEFKFFDVTDEDGETTDSIYLPAWTAGNLGVTVYFSPYEIASYADGLLTATVLYSEAEELFSEDAAPAPDYVTEMIPAWEFEYDLNNDGSIDVISFFSNYEYDPDFDESYITSAVISVNGKSEEIADLYAFGTVPYLVHIEDGTELAVIQIENMRGSDIYIYDITDGAPAYSGTINGGFDKNILTGLEGITVGTMSNIAGTFYATKDYEFGELGSFTSEDEQCEISTELMMFTTVELTLPIVDDGEVTGESLEIPEGTALTPVATNCSSYLDLYVFDLGDVVRLDIEQGEDERNQYIEDGRSIEDIFEMIYWAD